MANNLTNLSCSTHLGNFLVPPLPSSLPPPLPVSSLPHAPPPNWLPLPPPPAVTKTTSAVRPVLKKVINHEERKLYIKKPNVIESIDIIPRATYIAKTIKECRDKVIQNPTPERYFDLISTLLDFDRADEALPVLKELVSTGCDDPLINYYRGLIFVQNGDFNEATKEFEKCVKSSPNNVAAWERLIEVYLEGTESSSLQQEMESKFEESSDGFTGITLTFLCFQLDETHESFLTLLLENIRDNGHPSYNFIARYCLARLVHASAPFLSHPSFIALMDDVEKNERPLEVHRGSLISRSLITLIEDCEEMLPKTLTLGHVENEFIKFYALYLDSFLERHPNDLEIRSSKFAFLLRCKRYQELLECAKEGAALNHRDSDSWYNLALAYLMLSNYNEALKCNIECYKYIQGINSKSDNAECLHLFGRIFEEQGQFPEALWCFSEANKENLDSTHCLGQVRCLYRLDNGVVGTNLAIGLLEGELEHEPFNFTALSYLCKFYIRGHRLEKFSEVLNVVKNLEDSKEVREFRHIVLYYLAKFQSKHHSSQSALDGYHSILLENPLFKKALQQVIVLSEVEDKEKIKVKIDILTSFYPTCAKSRIFCANFFNNIQDGALAKIHIDAAEEIDNKKYRARLHFQKARTLFFLKRYQESIDIANEVLKNSNISDLIRLIMYETLASCHYYLDNYDLSLKFYTKYFEVDQSARDPKADDQMLYNRSLVYTQQKKWKEAICDLEMIRKRDPGNKSYLMELIECYFQMDHSDKKLETLINEFHKKYPWELRYVHCLTNSLLERGFLSSAILKLEEILKLPAANVKEIPEVEQRLKFLKAKTESTEKAEKIAKAAEAKMKAAADEKRRADFKNWRENLYKKPAAAKKKKKGKAVDAKKTLSEPQKNAIGTLLEAVKKIKAGTMDLKLWANELLKFYDGFYSGQDLDLDENTGELLNQSTDLDYLKKNIDRIYKALEKLTI